LKRTGHREAGITDNRFLTAPNQHVESRIDGCKILLIPLKISVGYHWSVMNGKSVLVVEDEASIAEVVSLYLKRAGYSVRTAADGKQAMSLLEREIPDFVILDLMLPEVDGLSLTRWLRDRSDVPIIMLTARREEIDRIAGLEMGADDYVVKPFSPQELVSRVRAVMRRLGREQPEIGSEEPLDFAELSIDPRSRVVTVNTTPVELTAKEFDMLYLLARHPRQVFTREQLLERVWGGAQYIDPGTVTVHVRRLREKIEADPSHPTRLLTIWGVGYKFEP
jgi:DNA-binding response OmpR family regulator